MPTLAKSCLLWVTVLIGSTGVAVAQQAAPQSSAPQSSAPASSTPAASAPAASAPAAAATTPAPGGSAAGANPSDKLVLLFDTGSAALDSRDKAILDHASRLYRDGRPIVMIVSGSADTVGSPASNLTLSLRRAVAVAKGLMARGIPAERTQILAKGVTDLAVPDQPGQPQAQDRRVEISWR
jgi:OOP family OmpA-OmpF porin